jgi:hypothetical protein
VTQQAAVQRIVRDAKDEARSATNRYGVVFVHGIGSQTQSSTLREQADPLIRWLRQWHADAAKETGHTPDRENEFGVVWSFLSYGADIDGPARLRLQIPEYDLPARRRQAAAETAVRRREETGEEPPEDVREDHYDSQTWILTEGWWAARLEAPNFRTMLSWSNRTVGIAVRRLKSAFQRQEPGQVFDTVGLRQFASRHWIASAIEKVSGWLVVGLYQVVGLVITPIVWLLALIAQIPIPGLNNFIVFKVMRPLVFEGIGDVYTYLWDEAQALHMRRSLEEAVTWLVTKEECEHVIVVAHSGGAPIAYDSLANRAVAPTCKHDVPAYAFVRALVTVGGALNNAWEPGVAPDPPFRLRDNLCAHTKWTDIWSSYDIVAGGSITHEPKPDEDVTMTNHLSVLADHGGYWENTEEYSPRIAQLIESPEDRHRSRFWDPIRVEWAEQRRDRVTTAVGWRLAAFAMFFVALMVKVFNATVDADGDPVATASRFIDGRIAADGRRLIEVVQQIPIIGGALDGLTEVLAVAPDFVKVLGADIVGLAVWAALSALGYLLVVRLVFDPWAERQALHSIMPPTDPPASQVREIGVRSTIVLVTLAAIAYGVSALNLSDLTFAPLIVIVGVVIAWALAWRRFGPTIRPPKRPRKRLLPSQLEDPTS